jgi:hypothetical protein
MTLLKAEKNNWPLRIDIQKRAESGRESPIGELSNFE